MVLGSSGGFAEYRSESNEGITQIVPVIVRSWCHNRTLYIKQV